MEDLAKDKLLLDALAKLQKERDEVNKRKTDLAIEKDILKMKHAANKILADSNLVLEKEELTQEQSEKLGGKKLDIEAREQMAKLRKKEQESKARLEQRLKAGELKQAEEDGDAEVVIQENTQRAARNARIFLSKAEEDQQQKLAEAKVRRGETERAKEEVAVRDEARIVLYQALEINPETIVADQKLSGNLSLAKFLFLFVIIGCELDLYGFSLAAATYWNAGVIDKHCSSIGWVMRGMLIIGPVGYFLAVGWYSYRYRHAEQEFAEREDEVQGLVDLPRSPQKEPIHLKPFHFFPILRYYLLIKDQEPQDVEGLFRVNGLSTFTIGFAQIFCAAIGLSKNILHFDIFLKIGVLAQAVNIGVTFIYFGTPWAQMMKAGIAIDAFIYSSDEELRLQMVQYEGAVSQMSKNSENEDALQVVDNLHRTADLDIKETCRLGNVEQSLKLFTMAEKTRIRRILRLRKSNEFARIGKAEKFPRKKRCTKFCGCRKRRGNAKSDAGAEQRNERTHGTNGASPLLSKTDPELGER